MFFKMLLYSFVIIMLYLMSFYFIMPVTMTKRQIMIHIPVSVVWAIVLFVCGNTMSLEFKIFWGLFFELGYILSTVYFFTEGDVFQNFFYFYSIYEIANGIILLSAWIFNRQFVDVLLLPDIEKACIKDFIPIYIIILVIFFVFRPILMKISKFSEDYAFIYRYLVVVWMLFNLVEYLIRIARYCDEGQIMRADIRAFGTILALVILIYIVIWIKRKTMKQQKQMLERTTMLIREKYKHIVEENRHMRQFRHEINRHTEMVKDVSKSVPHKEIKNYLKKLEQQGSIFLEVSLSGNVYLDSVVEKYYKILKEQGILLETVLEPVKINDRMAMEIICVVEEMFTMVLYSIRYKKWCRFSIRTRNNMLLCQLETEYDNNLEYYRHKGLDMIGNEMLVREHLSKTRSIAYQRDGATLYKLEKSRVTLAVMISQ